MTEEEAYEFVESRLWPIGPVCPRCGVTSHSEKLKGKSTRMGVYKCYGCRKPFRVTLGTVFARSHIPLNIWVEALALFAASKTGVTCDKLESLGMNRTSAWKMMHLIRDFSRYQPENFQRLTG